MNIIPRASDLFPGPITAGQQILELIIFILQPPESNEEAKALASRLWGELEPILSTEEIEGAFAEVRLRKLDENNYQFLIDD